MKTIKSKIRVRGVITIRAYRAGTKELLQEIIQKNMIMVSSGRGLDLLVQRLTGDTTYTAIINYGAIGTGSTAPAASDTQLATESARAITAYTQDVGFSEAVLQFFFSDASLANTTYREFGTFVDGSGSANSGRLFNRALFSTAYVKAAGTDTTVEVDISFV